MKYIKLEWFHDIETEPNIIYSEINNQQYEVRKVEVYKGGVFIKCSEEMVDSQIELADVPFPLNLDEINEDKQFLAKYISKEDFEKIWNKND